MKALRLGQRVLALARIEHEQHLVRRGWIEPRDDTLDLLDLVHEARRRVQAAGGVCDDDVDIARASRDERVVNDRRRVRPGLLCDDWRAGAFAPLLQLLDGGRAERIRGREEHRIASSLSI